SLGGKHAGGRGPREHVDRKFPEPRRIVGQLINDLAAFLENGPGVRVLLSPRFQFPAPVLNEPRKPLPLLANQPPQPRRSGLNKARLDLDARGPSRFNPSTARAAQARERHRSEGSGGRVSVSTGRRNGRAMPALRSASAEPSS